MQINGVQLHVDILASCMAPPTLRPHPLQQSVAGERDDGENMLAVTLPQFRSDSITSTHFPLARTSHMACLEAGRVGSSAALGP